MDTGKDLRPINEAELALLRTTFKENEYLLKKIRALMYGFPVSAEDKDTIKKTFASDELKRIMRKRFLAPMDIDAPIGELSDYWLGVENMTFGQPPEVINQAIEYKQGAWVMTNKALALLEDPDGETPDIDYTPIKYPNDPLQINLMVRNKFISNVENQLMFIWIIAQQEIKTPEEMKKIREKDSLK